MKIIIKLSPKLDTFVMGFARLTGVSPEEYVKNAVITALQSDAVSLECDVSTILAELKKNEP